MRQWLGSSLVRASGAAFAAALLAGAASPAFAQKTVEEVTVTGRIPKLAPETVNYRVGYADLDLGAPAGITELNRRIRVAANYICEQVNSGLDVGTCQTKAIMEVKDQIRKATRDQPHPFEPGPSWTPPPGKK
jgi:UrcA family protein